MGVSTFRIETGYDTVDPLGSAEFVSGRGFLLDLVTPIFLPSGIPFSPGPAGELPFGWLESSSGTFDFDFPTLVP
jgi:hypothetical protein